MTPVLHQQVMRVGERLRFKLIRWTDTKHKPEMLSFYLLNITLLPSPPHLKIISTPALFVGNIRPSQPSNGRVVRTNIDFDKNNDRDCQEISATHKYQSTQFWAAGNLIQTQLINCYQHFCDLFRFVLIFYSNQPQRYQEKNIHKSSASITFSQTKSSK